VARLNRQASQVKPRRTHTARATSCGGVVIAEIDGRLQTCLGLRRRERDGTSWVLPKGTPAPGETTEQTALREVAEETGLEVRIVAPIGSIEYFFTQSGTRIHKTVHFFLMAPTGGALDRHDHEFEEVHWVPLPDAAERLTFPTERRMLDQARTLVGSAPPAGA
jgi:8-oxo-dGTP pyrophosphatase MutT (NUDIX family)